MQRIYLDANATTPVLPAVVEAMLPYFTECSGNPSSAHLAGQRTRAAVERARAAVASLLHCAAKEIVFTSGGTESDNLALTGILQPFLDHNEPAHLITTQIEHHAVLYAAEALEKRGIRVTYLAPNRGGLIEPAALEAALTPETKLISVMLANNETGVIQPVGKLARIAKAYNPAILVHTDAVQAAGKLPLDTAGEFKNIDLLSISGHKMYAPQGTGALFIRSGVHLMPLQYGGPQERQRRAGTENVPGIVALGRAAELAQEFLHQALEPHSSQPTAHSSNIASLSGLRDSLEQGLLAAIPGTHINGSTAHRAPNTTNIRFEGIDAESLLIALDMQGIAASFGAACQSGATEPSHVLLAMGLTPAEARSSLRLSLSRHTTAEEIDRALQIIPAAVARLRKLA
ncbi:aminotransferase class V-fold PLP-dependent enzyme [Granulicella sp. 5B5]|uniref:cysteine desulfurase family protein n=1 Tax=Granulicella sp. 5B5 TaxID=1617967 RepID=UPI0015F3FB38|nr:cysteine desulfurase family protein [Granulicella sp. 5B5]QMV17610.1 aminotransferase class V-fold PLP-dependent enzyme [Granulicella sp. 5B5]